MSEDKMADTRQLLIVEDIAPLRLFSPPEVVEVTLGPPILGV